MKKFLLAAAMMAIGASAHAETYSVEGVTVHFQSGCRSSSCVSVYAPGYGYYHEGRSARIHKTKKDTARIASVTRKDDAAPTAEATPAKTSEIKTSQLKTSGVTPEAKPETAPQTISDPASAK